MLCSLSCHSQTRLSSNAALGLRLVPAETLKDVDMTRTRLSYTHAVCCDAQIRLWKEYVSFMYDNGQQAPICISSSYFYLLNFVGALSGAYPSDSKGEKISLSKC